MSEKDLTRRQFVHTTAAGAALLVVRCGGARVPAPVSTAGAADAPVGEGSPFALPPLPWADDALEPHISARTIGFHHGKHHAGYVGKINAKIAGSAYEGLSLEEVIVQSASKPADSGIFDNAAQVFNHTFYWESMKPMGGGVPQGALADLIDASFGSVDGFREAFSAAASGQFGSGWAWLVENGGKLDVTATSNADTPVAHGTKPLLCIDVWEHAYYLDWQNRRGDYIAAWLDHLVSWDAASARLG